MALQFFGIDSSETKELDFSLEEGRARVALAKKRVEDLRAAEKPDPAAVEEAAKTLADHERDLAAYAPGSGPVFTVGLIPGAKRAELLGLLSEMGSTPRPSEFQLRDHQWARELVRWTVRGHRGWLSSKGRMLEFKAETVVFDGEERQVPSGATLESYTPILHSLARYCQAAQKLEDAEKNA